MKAERTYNNIPPEGIATPNGYFYYPPTQGIQILFLIAAFFSAIFLGWLITNIAAIKSEFASGVLYFVFILIFFLGYGLWVGLASALAFSRIKWPLIKIIAKFFLRKEKPSSINDILPEREKLIEIMVRIQKYSRTFLFAGWTFGILGGLVSLFMTSSIHSILLFCLVLISLVIYGHLLFYFGRRGYFPLPEE